MLVDEPEVVASWADLRDDAVAEILGSTRAMTLATTGPGPTPHAAPLFYAYDARLTLYFLSDPATRHAREIAAGEFVAAAIHPEEGDWRRLRGLQLSGTVRSLAPGRDRERGWRTYAGRFPVVVELPDAVAHSQLYALRPDWLRLIDNRRGFGFRREWRLATDRSAA
jgi:uncharacterized protein YhbP (UPF0306 family)